MTDTPKSNTDGIWQRAEIESPCVKICVIQPESRLCVGCMRSADEIAGWNRMTPEARRNIMAELPGRVPLLVNRRGGRAARLAQAARDAEAGVVRPDTDTSMGSGSGSGSNTADDSG